MAEEQFVAAVCPMAAWELAKANELAGQHFYTEAVVRLGRAVEAALYETARVGGVDVLDRSIAGLEKVREKILQKQASLLRKKSIGEVHGLCEIASDLSRAIALLAEDDELRVGTETENPRRTGQLLRALVQVTDDPVLKRRFEELKGLAEDVQATRNVGAHASPSGARREIEREAFDELKTKAEEFIRTLASLIVGMKAGRAWPTPNDLPAVWNGSQSTEFVRH